MLESPGSSASAAQKDGPFEPEDGDPLARSFLDNSTRGARSLGSWGKNDLIIIYQYERYITHPMGALAKLDNVQYYANERLAKRKTLYYVVG